SSPLGQARGGETAPADSACRAASLIVVGGGMSRAGRRTGSRSAVIRCPPAGVADSGTMDRLAADCRGGLTAGDRRDPHSPARMGKTGGVGMKRLAAAALAVLSLAWSLAVAAPAQAADPTWVRSWGASPQAPMAALGPFLASPTFHDVTLRQVVRLSGGGKQVRIRFTNEFGTAPLAIGGAHVAIAAAGGAIQPGSDHALTFAGKPTAVVPAGAPLVSDPVDLRVGPLQKLTISLYLPGQVETCTCHGTAVETGWTIPGDAAAAAAP